MTYGELQEANSRIKYTDVKGKEYAQVHDRVMAFRSIFPNGEICTKLEKLDDDMCVFSARIYDEDGKILGTGHAAEVKGSSPVNKTSYIENCETSAVGRALGMVGIGIKVGIASAEEVRNALDQQLYTQPIGKVKAKALRSRFEEDNISEQKVVDLYKVVFLEDLTERQHRNLNDNYEQLKKRCMN